MFQIRKYFFMVFNFLGDGIVYFFGLIENYLENLQKVILLGNYRVLGFQVVWCYFFVIVLKILIFYFLKLFFCYCSCLLILIFLSGLFNFIVVYKILFCFCQLRGLLYRN